MADDEEVQFPIDAPVQDVADALADSHRLQHPEETVGFCMECKNVQPDQHMIRSPFFQEGSPVPCRYCGGVTVIVAQELIDENFKSRMDSVRGLGSTRSVG